MKEPLLEYYDPLYETISFERGLPSKFPVDSDLLDVREIIRCAEFARLAFLRQVGLAWLVFPSATHSRFAHSIGCWALGRMAESEIKVRVQGDRRIHSLSKWLKFMGLREEFYLGLLFHDIGHGPLSHVLEHNEHFIAALKAAGLKEVDHEHRGTALLEGENVLAKAWRQIAPERYGADIKTLADVRIGMKSELQEVCLPAICYFMTSDLNYLAKCNHPHKASLTVVKELVSGVLDLDRIDHYSRDSYFSGLRQINMNVRGFLSKLYITPPADPQGEVRISLTEDGVSFAANLLFGKVQILRTMFRNSKSIALHAMVNWALSAYLEYLGDDAVRANTSVKIALMEDDQFLQLITDSQHAGCRYMGQRIRAMRSYLCLGKWQNDGLPENPSALREALDSFMLRIGPDGAPAVLMHYDKGFWDSPQDSYDWLNTQRLRVEDSDVALSEHAEYKNNFEHLRESARVKYLWVFLREGTQAQAVEKEISSLLEQNIIKCKS